VSGRRIRAVLTLALALGAGCTDAGIHGRPAVSGTAPPTSPSPPGITPRPTADDLIGRWVSRKEGTELSYEFRPGRNYRYDGRISQEVPEGEFVFTVTESGVLTLGVGVLTLRPRSATATRRHPETPEEDYTNRPRPLTPRRLTWRVEGDELTLVETIRNERITLTFTRA